MTTKLLRNRRKFSSEWDEIGYFYDKLLYWLYNRADLPKARRYASRLERLLPKADPRHDAIFGEECWSLIHEAKGDFLEAIRFRKNEIRLIRKLQRIARGKPNEEALLRNYSPEDLSDRLDLLAELFHDVGDHDKAIKVLRESMKLCQDHGIRFDGEDILQRCLNARSRKKSRDTPEQ